MLLCYWGHWKIPLRVLKNMFILWEFSFPDSNTWTCWEGNTTDKISPCCFDPDHRRLKKILPRYCALFVNDLELIQKHWRIYLSWCFSFRNSTGFAERGEDRRTVMTSLERERCRDGGGKGRPLIRLMHWAAVCPYKGVWLHGRVPVGSAHALSSGLRGGEGSVSTMHTDRWESSQREAVLYLSICLLDRRSGFISTVAMCEGRRGRCFNWDQWS